MKANFIVSGFFMCLAFVGGIWLAHSSWSGTIFLAESLTQSRNPSSIPKKVMNAWHMARSQDELVRSAKVVLAKDSSGKNTMGVEFGHFLARDRDGRGRLACDLYSHVTVSFEAEGVADSGEKPVMKVEGPCQMSEDGSVIQALYVPVDRIRQEHSTDMDLKYDDLGTSYSFANMTAEWPTHWRLISVRLDSEDAELGAVDFSGHVLNEKLQHPIILNW